MTIKERIEKIKIYFKELQIVTMENVQYIYIVVQFPRGWVVDEEIQDRFNVTVERGNCDGEFYFCGEIDNGEDKVFDAIEHNILKMKEAIERAQLLSEKTLELKHLFENESISLDQLRTLKISYNEIPELVITKPKEQIENKDKKKNENE